MRGIADELDRRLKVLDPAVTERLERVVRDALDLVDALENQDVWSSWPVGYFERNAGALAAEEIERSQ